MTDPRNQIDLSDFKVMLFLLGEELPENRRKKAEDLVGAEQALSLLAVFSGSLAASWCDQCHREVWFSDLNADDRERSRNLYYCADCLDKGVLIECRSPGPGIYHRH